MIKAYFDGIEISEILQVEDNVVLFRTADDRYHLEELTQIVISKEAA